MTLVPPRAGVCPTCGQPLPGEGEMPLRVTESVTTEAKSTAKKPYGNVEYADPGYQSDKKKRYPLDTEDHVRSAWAYINMARNAKKYEAGDLKKVKARIRAAMRKLDISVSANSTTEALINGKLSFDDIREKVRRAIRARMAAMSADNGYCWAYIVDLSDTEVVYCDDSERLFLCSYTLSGDEVTLGEQQEVARTYAPVGAVDGELAVEAEPVEPAAESMQSCDTFEGRVLEAKGTDKKTGGRIFRVQLIAYGDSKNGRRYPESVLRKAASLYEGAKSFDHHRTQEEMATGTIQGLVGCLRDVEAATTGLEADLYLLPSATLAAEALDAALASESEEPLVGMSHDVWSRFRPVQEGGRQIQEAMAITSVNSVDIVSDPAAGGRATRVVAGGVNPEDASAAGPSGESTKEPDVGATKADVLAAFKEATDEELALVGLARASETETDEGKVTETVEPEAKATETVGELKGSFLGKMLIKSKVEDAGLPASVAESLTGALPDRVTEAIIDSQIAALKSVMGVAERAGLAPQLTATVTKEARQKKIDALDAFFSGDSAKGYRSFREAFVDFTGQRPASFDEDFNRTILRESFGGGFNSIASRSTESMDSTTWNLALGDSITRRMVAEYSQPSLQTWRQIVATTSVNDFRTQRIDRIGGYGTLPTVGQGAPYQPLTSPTNEEITYAITKRGGTEDVTLEMVANDDIRAIQRIPSKLGLAAAQTLYRFVWDFLVTNAATSYDSVALFHATHANTAAVALSQSNLSAARRAMRKQTAYGDSSDVLSIVPKFLIVCSDLEELAYQLTTSAVAIPATPAGPTDTPNIHQGLTPIVVDYWTSTTQWHTVADPGLVPTFEIGFYQGRQEPELFTQADNSVGSVFNADKITYKIRHIYSGAVLDHRGLYRGNS